MADLASAYTLATSTGTALFNDGVLASLDDFLYLTNVTGLEADIRNPKDKAPVAHGAKLHRFWEDGLEPRFEGIYLIQSTHVQQEIRELRNAMHRALKEVLRGAFDLDGTLSWVEPEPGGDVSYELDVSYEIVLTPGFDANWTIKTFSFGLAAEASVPTVVA